MELSGRLLKKVILFSSYPMQMTGSFSKTARTTQNSPPYCRVYSNLHLNEGNLSSCITCTDGLKQQAFIIAEESVDKQGSFIDLSNAWVIWPCVCSQLAKSPGVTWSRIALYGLWLVGCWQEGREWLSPVNLYIHQASPWQLDGVPREEVEGTKPTEVYSQYWHTVTSITFYRPK